MNRAHRVDGRIVPWALSALALALAFWQRPFATYTDTRIELSADPGLFLERVGHLWSPTADLGHVQASQFIGYLFPMAPYFAAADALGVPMVVAQRLWIGGLLALAAWGVVRLLDRLWDPRRGVAHFAAGVLYLANPYVVVVLNRGSAWLLAYAALPWLLVLGHGGVRRPRSWRAPAALGLIVAAAGGGINAAVLGWVLAGLVALLAWEWLIVRRAGRDVLRFSGRALVCIIAASLWWIVPLMLAGRYGTDYLSYSERPESILATPSASESLRLLGYWVSYFGTGFDGSEPVVPAIGSYLFRPLVIAGSFAVPIAAVGALPWTRRWGYAGFFAALGAAGVLVMTAGFPEGTVLNRVLTSAYYEAGPLQFLRTTYKAAPLVGLSLSVLAGVGVAMLVARAQGSGLRVLGTRVPAWTLAFLAIPAMLWAEPLWRGRTIDPLVAYGNVPAAWRAAVADAQRQAPANTRIAVLPGSVFGWYRWGGTWDSIVPAISRRPVVERSLLPWADLRSSELLFAMDDLVQQGRLTPGQLPPLLQLMGVGRVIVGSDTRRLRSGSLDPAQAADVLSGQPGFAVPAAAYGPAEVRTPQRGRGGPSRLLPQVRAYEAPRPARPGIVRAHPVARPVVLEGDAHGVAALAGVGGLETRRALFYAADLSPPSVASRVRAGASLVFTDSNRRRGRVPARLGENLGAVVEASERLDRRWAEYKPFQGVGPEAQTVAVYTGLRSLRTPATPGFSIFPEHRPYAAFDGRIDTAWLAAAEDPDRRFLELELARPKPVREILLRPHADAAGATSEVEISINGGPGRRLRLRGGWNRVAVGADRLRTLRVSIAAVRGAALIAGLGGIDELRVPGVRVREALRLPTRLAAQARRLDLSRTPITVVVERQTADFPGRAGAVAAAPQSTDPLDAVDPERELRRVLALPVARRYRITGWARAAADASSVTLDRLTGVPAPWTFVSSPRFEGVAGSRASSAFDGDPATAWVGEVSPTVSPWIAWRGPRELTIRELRLVIPPGPFRRPTRLRVFTARGPVLVRVNRAGLVRLPAPVRADGLRLEIAASAAPDTEAGRRLRGIAIAEIRVPGLQPPAPRRKGPVVSRCGELSLAGPQGTAALRVTGSAAALDAGSPLALVGCGSRSELALPAGSSTLRAPPGAAFTADTVRLDGAPPVAPAPLRQPFAPVVGAVRAGQGGPTSAEVRLQGPTWLVLGESWSAGWRAWCRDGAGRERALGEPVPIDGFANGWRVGADCRYARFAFQPQRLATIAQIASLLAALVLLAVVAVAAVSAFRAGRIRRALTLRLPELAAWQDRARATSWPVALGTAAAVGAFAGAAGAWRVGAGLAALTVILLREGLTARRLYVVGAVLTAVVPALYLVDPVENRTGFDFGFAARHLEAHWFAVSGMICVLTAALLDAYDRRTSASASATSTASARNSKSS